METKTLRLTDDDVTDINGGDIAKKEINPKFAALINERVPESGDRGINRKDFPGNNTDILGGKR